MKAKRMKKQNNKENRAKKGIVLISLIIVIIALITGILYYKPIDASIIFQKHNNNINLSEELKKEKEFEGLIIKDITMKREDGITYFSANIENSTDKKFEEKDIKIVFQKEDLTQISILKTHIQNIEPDESVNIQLSTSANLIDAYTFKII